MKCVLPSASVGVGKAREKPWTTRLALQGRYVSSRAWSARGRCDPRILGPEGAGLVEEGARLSNPFRVALDSLAFPILRVSPGATHVAPSRGADLRFLQQALQSVAGVVCLHDFRRLEPTCPLGQVFSAMAFRHTARGLKPIVWKPRLRRASTLKRGGELCLVCRGPPTEAGGTTHLSADSRAPSRTLADARARVNALAFARGERSYGSLAVSLCRDFP
jgi:hypothetical protein